MIVKRKFENLEITVDVTNDEIISYLSSLPLKERKEMVQKLFEKDKENLVSRIKDDFDTLKTILGI